MINLANTNETLKLAYFNMCYAPHAKRETNKQIHEQTLKTMKEKAGRVFSGTYVLTICTSKKLLKIQVNITK